MAMDDDPWPIVRPLGSDCSIRDRHKFVRLEARPTDQGPVHVGLDDDLGRVVGLDAPAVEHAHGVGRLLDDDIELGPGRQMTAVAEPRRRVALPNPYSALTCRLHGRCDYAPAWSGTGPVAQPVFKIGPVVQPTACSVRLRGRSVHGSPP